MASNINTELKIIASQFVRQYYTLLNKAPNYIHNFYNHDSTFIHGTIELGSERHTEFATGRDQIESKVKDLKLNDCRAKIEQIDCLETLSGGLVIQVVGGLSNNGKPMRRFLQTFVLAPCHKEQPQRQDGDQLATTQQGSQQSQVNQKPRFYVLNSIFRYQDDGLDSEFEDDNSSIQANTSNNSASAVTNQSVTDEDHHLDNTIAGGKQSLESASLKETMHQPIQQHPQPQPQPVQPTSRPVAQQNITHEPQTKPSQTQERPTVPMKSHQGGIEPKNQDHKYRNDGLSNKTNSNQTNVSATSTDKKPEVPDRPHESVRSVNEQIKNQTNNQSLSDQSNMNASQSYPTGNAPAPTQPPPPKPNEPKTWANVISRSAHPNSSQPTTPAVAPVNQSSSKNTHGDQHNQHSQTGSHTTQQQQPSNNNQTQEPMSQNQQSHPSLQQIQQNQQGDQGPRGPNRRRNMIRKSSNKPPSGRSMKDRPRPPQPTGRPVV